MAEEIENSYGEKLEPGTKIMIISCCNPSYNKNVYEITEVTEIGFLKGTWGPEEIIPGIDDFNVVYQKEDKDEEKRVVLTKRLKDSYDFYNMQDWFSFIEKVKELGVDEVKSNPLRKTYVRIKNAPENFFDNIKLYFNIDKIKGGVSVADTPEESNIAYDIEFSEEVFEKIDQEELSKEISEVIEEIKSNIKEAYEEDEHIKSLKYDCIEAITKSSLSEEDIEQIMEIVNNAKLCSEEEV